MKLRLRLIALIAGTLIQGIPLNAQVYLSQQGLVSFTSEAPLELIQAQSTELKGAIDAEKHNFAFSLQMFSFQGFNSALQREHFNEKFLESDVFPKATFQGKLIETIDFSRPGLYRVRAKGNFNIHGVSQERIIRTTIRVVNEDEIEIEADFTVLVADHKITIPQIVYQNIAEEIRVSVRARLIKQKT